MLKQEFLARLEAGLAGLPRDEAAERLTFYSDMIDDRMEDGLSEEAAVAEIGPVDAVVQQILAEIPLPRLVRERLKPQGSLPAWAWVLLILGFPLWFPLLAAALAVVLSVYAVLWSLIIALWAVELAFAVTALALLASGVLFLCRGNVVQGMGVICGGLVMAGLAIFLFFGSLAATRGAVSLTGKIALGVKSLFLRKEKNV